MTESTQHQNQISGERGFGPSSQDESDAASHASDRIGSQINEAAVALKTKAREVVEPVKDHAVHVAEEQITTGAQKVEGIARAVHEAADKIEEEIPQAGTYVHQLADRLDDASRVAREQKMSDIVGAIDDFAHRQPLAFFGATILAGFALARFMRSSNGGQSWRSQPHGGDSGWSSEYGAPEGGGMPS
jgi:hypothetical protein